MADTLPADTTSQAVGDLTRPSDGRYTPSVDELVRQAAAARKLAEAAAEAEEALGDYVAHGLDREWHHQIDDPPVPPLLVRPHLITGGKS